MAVTRDGVLHIASLMNGGVAQVGPDGAALGFVSLPDPLTTNVAFNENETEMVVTLSGTGRLVRMKRPA